MAKKEEKKDCVCNCMQSKHEEEKKEPPKMGASATHHAEVDSKKTAPPGTITAAPKASEAHAPAGLSKIEANETKPEEHKKGDGGKQEGHKKDTGKHEAGQEPEQKIQKLEEKQGCTKCCPIHCLSVANKEGSVSSEGEAMESDIESSFGSDDGGSGSQDSRPSPRRQRGPARGRGSRSRGRKRSRISNTGRGRKRRRGGGRGGK